MTDTDTAGSTVRTHRFALCLSGGVALGAYMAGALAQLYRDFQVFNAAQSGMKLVVDAFAGSSAGSMTGLIMAQTVAFEPDAGQFAQKMWDCWVRQSDVLALLDPPDSRDESLFTDECLQAIADGTIRKPEPTDAFDPRRAVALWITITNLDGIPYCVNFRRPGVSQAAVQFFALSYRDYTPYLICGNTARYVAVPTEALCDLDPTDYMRRRCPSVQPVPPGSPGVPGYAPGVPERPADNWWWYSQPAPWSQLQEHALTSGAFPVAFRSRTITRNLACYPDYQEFKTDPQVQAMLHGHVLRDQVVAQCVDGGIFSNQPIGRAIDAVAYLESLDPERVPDNQTTFRTFLIVEPDPNTARQVAAMEIGREPEEPAHGLPPASILAKIISAYFNDALYSDFQQAEQTNEKLRALDSLAPATLSPDQLRAVKQALHMDYKREITLEHIPYSPILRNRLAGDFAGHFGGFLQEDLRAFDFRTGQYEARRWFLQWLAASAGDLAFDPAILSAPDAQSVFTESSLADPPEPSALAPEMPLTDWDRLDAAQREKIVVRGALRAQALTGRWIRESKEYLPAVGILLTPRVKQLLLKRPGALPEAPASLDWRGFLSALMGTPTAGPIMRGAACVLFVVALLAGMGLGAIPAALGREREWLWIGLGALLGGCLALALIAWARSANGNEGSS